MSLYGSLFGTVTVKLTSADIPRLLKAINQAEIHVFSLKHLDVLSVQITVYRWNLQLIKEITNRKGGEVAVIAKSGAYWMLRSLIWRPVLVFGLLVLLILSCYLPGRILFIEVEGNAHIPKNLILEQAQISGIYFGASRREVRSEQVKNRLLGLIPQLQWAGVNTHGCVAVITVRERTDTEPTAHPMGVASIVASRDGIITSCTATRGNLLCTAGQAVKAGQVLVSGYTDCGISIQATRAEGEITAQTSHDLHAIAPTVYTQKGDVRNSVKKYGLIIGKKRINFFKYSGISGTTCDKMYSEYYLTLPGGFRLPVALAVETWTVYDGETVSAASETTERAAHEYVRAYLLDQMLSGQILDDRIEGTADNGVYTINAHYECLEMIGRVQSEEIITKHGKSD